MRQYQTPSGTVIKIDRIASERIQPSTLNTPTSFLASISSNSSLSTESTSTTLRQRQDALFMDSKKENNFDNVNHQISQLQLKVSNSAPLPYATSTNSSLSTTFSPQLQRNTKIYDQPQNYNNTPNMRVGVSLSAPANSKLRANTVTNDQLNTTFSSEPATVQSIFVDPDMSAINIGVKKIIDPPGYGNYINQVNKFIIFI